VALEDAVDELALQPAVGHLLDLTLAGAGDALAEGARAPVLALDRCVEGDLGRGHAAGAADVVDGVVEGGGDFLVGGLPAELLGQEALGAGHADEGGVLVEWDPDAPGLLRQSLEHRLPDPPY